MTTTVRRAQARAEYEYAASALWRAADRTYVLERMGRVGDQPRQFFAGMDGEGEARVPVFTEDPEQAAWFYTNRAGWYQVMLADRYGITVSARERSRPAAVEPSEFDAREAVEAEGDGDG